MLAGDDLDENSVVIDAVDHSEHTSSGGVPALERTAKRLADAVGSLRERTPDEFEACDCDRFRQVLCQGTARARGQNDAIGHEAVWVRAASAAPTSSSVLVSSLRISASP